MVPQTIQTAEKKFESWRSALAERMHHAHGHLEALIPIDELRVAHTDELNISPAFWGLTQRAHLHAGILNLTTLLSKSSRVTSLPRLLDHTSDYLDMFSDSAYEIRLLKEDRFSESHLAWEVAEHAQVTRAIIAEHKEALHAFNTDIQNLKGWRDKVLAHIDSDFLQRAAVVTQVYPLHKSRLTKLVDTLGEVFNYYSVAYDGKWYQFGIPFRPGLDGMISILEKRNIAKYDGKPLIH